MVAMVWKRRWASLCSGRTREMPRRGLLSAESEKQENQLQRRRLYLLVGDHAAFGNACGGVCATLTKSVHMTRW